MFGLLGPNGAGKTTTIRLLTTLLPLQRGERRGSSAATSRRQPMAVRRLLGYVPQQLSAEGALTGRENVALFARLFDVPRRERGQRVDEVLDAMVTWTTPPTGSPRRTPAAWSAGWSWPRRSSTGRALLVLDEPTVGLDPVARDERLGAGRRDCSERYGDDRAAHHPLHGRGRRALRPGRAHAPGPHPRRSARRPS